MSYNILSLIGMAESSGMYNRVYGAGVKTEPLTSMTLSEVFHWQEQYVKVYKSPSSAVGKYQFIKPTLTEIVEALNISHEQKFDEITQDKCAKFLLRRRGYYKFLNGRQSLKKTVLELSKEWASLPKDKSGVSYYAGDGLNKSHVSYEAVVDAIKKDKKEYNKKISPIMAKTAKLTLWDKIKLFFKWRKIS